MKRFILQFKELYNNEALHSVEILNTGSASGTVYLTGAKTPFEWEEDDSDDLLFFTRRKTGSISIVVTPDTDISGLLPTSPTSHRVELDGVWIGYIEPLTFNIPMYSDVYTLKLNVTSFIGASTNTKVDEYWPSSLVKIFDLLREMTAAEYIILPKNYDFDRAYSALVVNPYRTDNDFKFETNDELFELKTVYEMLQEFCDLYMLTIHEVTYNGETAYLFTGYAYDGKYTVYDTEPQVVEDITIDDEDFYDIFTLMGNSNYREIIRPQRKITVEDSSPISDEYHFPFQMSKYKGLQLLNGEITYYLQPMASQLSSDYLRTQTSQHVPNSTNVIMCGRGKTGEDPEECIYLESIQPNTKILQATFYGLINTGVFRIEFDEIPTNMPNGSYDFRYSIKCGSKYWDDVNLEWSSTESIYTETISPSEKVLTTFGWAYDDDNDGQPVSIILYATTAQQSITCKIRDIVATCYKQEGLPDKYNTGNKKTVTMNGPTGAESETDLSCIFGYIRQRVNELTYMFDIQQSITVEVQRRNITAEDYMRKWTFGDDPLKYRLISVDDSVRESLMTLKFIGCETIS